MPIVNQSPKTIYLHAGCIKSGGGVTLLNALICSLSEQDHIVAMLESGYIVPENSRAKLFIKRVRSSICSRLQAEWFIARKTCKQDIVLCFGSLPPLFAVPAKTVVYMQNRYLLESWQYWLGHPIKAILRIAIESLWLRLRKKNVDLWIVQTPTMSQRLAAIVGNKTIAIRPYVSSSTEYSRSIEKTSISKSNYSFAYISSGEPHKNHRRLLMAWDLLAKEGLFPSLTLTISKQKMAKWANKLQLQPTLNIHAIGMVDHQVVFNIYREIDALIFPSIIESLGLPLIEARQAGLAILAPELDYVRDAIDPEETFDPYSAQSIAQAVKRFMGINQPTLNLIDAESFVNLIKS